MAEAMSPTSHRIACILAFRAVRHVTRYLDGEEGAARLADNVGQLQLEAIVSDPATSGLIDLVRFLNSAAALTARAALDENAARHEKMVAITAALAKLLADEAERFEALRP